jgi:ubiquitin C-terminal hydrolase
MQHGFKQYCDWWRSTTLHDMGADGKYIYSELDPVLAQYGIYLRAAAFSPNPVDNTQMLPPGIGAGFVNDGNTCYSNATFQVC